jgi:redox-sensitive bicupin YhaK (pirin superfamily)
VLTLRRAEQRRYERLPQQEVWRTFYPREPAAVFDGAFGALHGLDESCLQPGARVPRQARDRSEMITYVREGSLARDEGLGRSYLMQAGEFQRMSVGASDYPAEINASAVDTVRVFQIGLHVSNVGLEPGREQRRFSAAQRRGGLCLVASPDGRRGSLRVHADALLHSALLAPGQHIVHELAKGRHAWLHLVEGEVSLGEVLLGAGDGAGISADRAVSLTAQTAAEILLLDLLQAWPRTSATPQP